MSSTKIESCIWEIQLYLMNHYGCTAADREIAPLKWYVNTGRASLQFLHKLIDAKPFVIARILHKGGSDDSIIASIKTKLNLDD